MRPRLTIVAFVAGLAIAPASAAAGGCAASASWGTLKPSWERKVVALVNDHRHSLGLKSLKISRTLRRSARWKSRNMARFDYLEHVDPSGRSPFERMLDCGFKGGHVLGENIAGGQHSPKDVVRAWLESEEHRRNIEDPDFSKIGVGAAVRRGSHYGDYWTQDFGG